MSSPGSVRAPVILGLLIVVAAGAGSYAWLAASAPSRTASAAGPSAPPGPEVRPTISFATSGAGSPSPSPAPGWDQDRLDALTGLVPAGLAKACTPGTPSESERPATPRAVAAVQCRQAGNSVVYEVLPDLASADDAYASLVSDSGGEPDPGGCWDGTRGAVTYSYGQITCWGDPASGTATIAWTYEPANVVASVSGSSGLHALVNWWWFRALLQPAADSSGLSPEEEALLDLLPAGLQATCGHYDPLQDATGYKPVGSLGSVDCFPQSARVADVGFFQFTTAEALAAWYDYRVAQAGIEAASGGCLEGTPGETDWEHGRILCTVTAGGKAAIRWTDDRHQLYGALNATGRDLPSLVRWWTSQRLP